MYLQPSRLCGNAGDLEGWLISNCLLKVPPPIRGPHQWGGACGKDQSWVPSFSVTLECWGWSGRGAYGSEERFQGDPCEVRLGQQHLFSACSARGPCGHRGLKGSQPGPVAQRNGGSLPCMCRGQAASLGPFLWGGCPGRKAGTLWAL